MKNVFSYLSRMLLILCLALYGAMAGAGKGEAGILMEICSDGAIKTVLVDSEGANTKQSHDCGDCLMCTLGTNGKPNEFFGIALTFSMQEIENKHIISKISVIQKRNFRPIPRGPPGYTFSNLIVAGVATIDLQMYSVGRPSLKDAVV